MHRWNKNKKHIQPNFSGRMCFFACYLGKKSVPLLLQRFLNSNSHGNGSADHGVVAPLERLRNRAKTVHFRLNHAEYLCKLRAKLSILNKFSYYLQMYVGAKLGPNCMSNAIVRQ